ncbi:MAG: ribonuclease R [Rhodospirillales bacterium]
MAKKAKTSGKSGKSPFPSREEIIRFVRESDGRAGKREIARAFGLDARQKMDLKKLLRELELDGSVMRTRGKRLADPARLPPVAVVEVTGFGRDGDVLAKPGVWEGEDAPPPIIMRPEKKGRPALGPGDKALARLTPILADDGETVREYKGETIRRLTSTPLTVLGVLEKTGGHFHLKPTDKRAKQNYVVEMGDVGDAGPGDVVRCEVLRGRGLGLKRARVIERLGSLTGGRAASVIAIHQHGIPTEFKPEAIDQAEAATAAPLDGRTDLRAIPLVTIDGADARDFDDAVFAEPDEDNGNPGGFHLIVAIADVAWYVRPGSPLDHAAYERGNSVYFPDRVVPMLPEALSNGWCSLVPHEDRPCLAAHLWISSTGELRRHRFERAMMRSHARLTYEQAQAAFDGRRDRATETLGDAVLGPLLGAYRAFSKARKQRGVLELDMPERRVELDDQGNATGISVRQRFDSHKLIEEFMIAANVAAAETLERKRSTLLYRIHDQPGVEKIEALRTFLETLNLSLPKGQVLRAQQFNSILAKVADTEHRDMVNDAVLRAQAQAQYAPDNIGHFGLSLRRYCHFTSPIRRYADLVVHRALISTLGLGPGGIDEMTRDLGDAGEHLSVTERRAAAAERDTVDRYMATYMVDRVGATMTGRVTGVTRFGLFVALDETGADGLIPISTLPADYYRLDESGHALVGDDRGMRFGLGQIVDVSIADVDPITGGMALRLVAGGKPPPKGERRRKPVKKSRRKCEIVKRPRKR